MWRVIMRSQSFVKMSLATCSLYLADSYSYKGHILGIFETVTGIMYTQYSLTSQVISIHGRYILL